ncbi:addiction module protein [sulfur-oxidizing endosymbiont of Gigantopelta aegis]|uniref:addiction module protein n=1 Tax=sulfur-oxidizing endosymbiont of Gigantopelta aegis TaxID=2794934 RepID=UPI0018DB5747|nr:addiction module protein [sulfur-oxidizing endosymbiont of Gigantopelta aegis]
MTNSVNMILDQALELSASERADVAEKLLFSLDRPDSTIDALWAKEADSRVEAYKKGEIEAVSAEKVFAKYRKT